MTYKLLRILGIVMSIAGSFVLTTAVQAATLYDLDDYSAVARLVGQNSSRQVGSDIASAGDIDGDGYDDFIVGESAGESESAYGRFHIIYGTAAGYANGQFPDVADATFVGFSNRDILGDSVVGAGDINGDGYADIIVGSPGIENGAAYILLGQPTRYSGSADIETAADIIIKESITQNRLGDQVAGVGDLDDDGYDDFAVTHYLAHNGNTGNAGAVYIFYGNSNLPPTLEPSSEADATIRGTIEREYFGTVIAKTVADYNSDGYNDLLIGSNLAGETAPSAYLFYGSGTRLSGNLDTSNADASILMDIGSSGFGNLSDLDAIGDVNGDGYDDFILGAYDAEVNNANRGSAFMFMGSATPFSGSYTHLDADARLEGQTESSWYGFFVSGINDLNADGYDEFMISSRYGNGGGNAYLYYGDASAYIGTLNGPGVADVAMYIDSGEDVAVNMFGESGGDLNGDGLNDLLVSIPLRDGSAVDAGSVYVVLGESTAFQGFPRQLLFSFESTITTKKSGLIEVQYTDGDMLRFDLFKKSQVAPAAEVLRNRTYVGAVSGNGRLLKIVNAKGKLQTQKKVLKKQNADEVQISTLNDSNTKNGQEIVVSTWREKKVKLALYQFKPKNKRLVRRNHIFYTESDNGDDLLYVANENEIQFIKPGMTEVYATYRVQQNQLVEIE